MKNNNKTILSALLVSVFVCGNAIAGTNFQYTSANSSNYSQAQSGNLQGYALYVPAGTATNAILSQELNSSTASVGQTVSAILSEDFKYNGTVIAPAGSTISGTVTKNKKAGIANRNAEMEVRFTTIRTPYNNVIPVSAVISTNDLSGILKGGTKKDAAKEYAKDAVVGAGLGAVLGTAMGAMAGGSKGRESGSVGRGAIYGTALGGGLGVAKAVATKGENISIPSNSQINIVFDQPITLGTQY